MITIADKDFLIVKKILSKHLHHETVWAFGSRVNSNTVKKYSDLDLVIVTETPIPTLTMALLREDFSESDLSIKIDILDWSVTNSKISENYFAKI